MVENSPPSPSSSSPSNDGIIIPITDPSQSQSQSPPLLSSTPSLIFSLSSLITQIRRSRNLIRSVVDPLVEWINSKTDITVSYDEETYCQMVREREREGEISLLDDNDFFPSVSPSTDSLSSSSSSPSPSPTPSRLHETRRLLRQILQLSSTFLLSHPPSSIPDGPTGTPPSSPSYNDLYSELSNERLLLCSEIIFYISMEKIFNTEVQKKKEKIKTLMERKEMMENTMGMGRNTRTQSHTNTTPSSTEILPSSSSLVSIPSTSSPPPPSLSVPTSSSTSPSSSSPSPLPVSLSLSSLLTKLNECHHLMSDTIQSTKNFLSQNDNIVDVFSVRFKGIDHLIIQEEVTEDVRLYQQLDFLERIREEKWTKDKENNESILSSSSSSSSHSPSPSSSSPSPSFSPSSLSSSIYTPRYPLLQYEDHLKLDSTALIIQSLIEKTKTFIEMEEKKQKETENERIHLLGEERKQNGEMENAKKEEQGNNNNNNNNNVPHDLMKTAMDDDVIGNDNLSSSDNDHEDNDDDDEYGRKFVMESYENIGREERESQQIMKMKSQSSRNPHVISHSSSPSQTIHSSSSPSPALPLVSFPSPSSSPTPLSILSSRLLSLLSLRSLWFRSGFLFNRTVSIKSHIFHLQQQKQEAMSLYRDLLRKQLQCAMEEKSLYKQLLLLSKYKLEREKMSQWKSEYARIDGEVKKLEEKMIAKYGEEKWREMLKNVTVMGKDRNNDEDNDNDNGHEEQKQAEGEGVGVGEGASPFSPSSPPEVGNGNGNVNLMSSSPSFFPSSSSSPSPSPSEY